MPAEPLTRILLLRHGRVADSWRGRIYGGLDVPLAPAGEDESRRAAALLASERLDAVVSSGLARTEFLAALLRAPRGLARRDEPDLAEIDRGAWGGRAPAEVDRDEDGAWRRWLAEPELRAPAGGESLAALATRVLPRVDALAGELPGGRVAVAAHAWVVRVCVCAALGLSLRSAPRLAVRTGEVVVLDWPAGGVGDPRAPRPTLVGFAVDRVPAAGPGWYRAPRP